jgi:hypothetical protein
MTGSLSSSILSMARSVSGSVPMMLGLGAAAVGQRDLDIVGAFTTWLLVRM